MCVCKCACVCLCVHQCTLTLCFCVYCMCGCVGLVSQLPSFAALVKRGATLMRRETDSVSAAPDRVCGPLWMKLVQSPRGVLALKGGNPWSIRCLVHCTQISVAPCVQPFFSFSLF